MNAISPHRVDNNSFTTSRYLTPEVKVTNFSKAHVQSPINVTRDTHSPVYSVNGASLGSVYDQGSMNYQGNASVTPLPGPSSQGSIDPNLYASIKQVLDECLTVVDRPGVRCAPNVNVPRELHFPKKAPGPIVNISSSRNTHINLTKQEIFNFDLNSRDFS